MSYTPPAFDAANIDLSEDGVFAPPAYNAADIEFATASVGAAASSSAAVGLSAALGASAGDVAIVGCSASIGVALGVVEAIADSTSRGLAGGAAAVAAIAAALGGALGDSTAEAVGPGSQYPSFIQRIGSRLVPRDDIRTDRAVSGALRQRAMYGSLRSDLTLVHTLSSANLALLLTFYSVNRTTRFNIEWQGSGAVYAVKFAKPPHYVWTDNRWHVEVDLAQA